MLSLSIVLISHNSLPRLRQCLRALAAMIGRADTEVVWVDNGSTDGANEWVKATWPQVRTKRLTRNMGVAYARNRGIEMSRGQHILILDDDTEASVEAIEAMLAHMRQHPQCGVCAVPLTDADGHAQHTHLPYPSLRRKARNVLASWSNGDDTAQSNDGKAEYVIGACQMTTRAVVDRVGPLDEGIFYGPEDADYCLRAVAAGYTVDYLADAPAIVHHWRRATRRNPFSRLGWLHTKGLFRFWWRHRRF